MKRCRTDDRSFLSPWEDSGASVPPAQCSAGLLEGQPRDAQESSGLPKESTRQGAGALRQREGETIMAYLTKDEYRTRKAAGLCTFRKTEGVRR
jgi:hypothetical protein